MSQEDSLRRVLLEMKSRTGRLTDEEREELLRMPRFVGGEDGGGVLVVGAKLTQEQWIERFRDARLPDSPPALPQE